MISKAISSAPKLQADFKKSHQFSQDIGMQIVFHFSFTRKSKLITANHLTEKQTSTLLHKNIKLSWGNIQVTWQLAPSTHS
jgi:hypothetical protein